MKKIAAMVLALVMILALVGCTSDSAGDSGSKESIAPAESTTAVPEVIGFFDRNYDYSQNKTYKIVYLTNMLTPVHEDFINALKLWCDKLNMTVEVLNANGDNDYFMTSIDTVVSSGIDGLMFDSDLNYINAATDKCRELGIPFMVGIGGSVDPTTGLLCCPMVGFDEPTNGHVIMTWVDEYRQENWPDCKPEDVGIVGVTFSSSPPINQRVVSAQELWTEMYPDCADNFFIGDCITGSLNAATAYSVAGAIISAHPEFKYWIGIGGVDDFANGFANAATDAGFENTSASVAVGGPTLIAQWDAGTITPWKSSACIGELIRSEGMVCCLYAQMAGWATQEEMWPEYRQEGQKYSAVLSNVVMITKDNYQHFLEWTDLYTGMNLYNYPVENVSIDDYVALMTPEQVKAVEIK